MCYDNIDGPFRALSGLDGFDIRVNESEATYPTAVAPLIAYLNQPEVQDALGVASNYTSDNAAIMFAFFQSGDGALGGFLEDVAELVDAGVDVLLFHGDADYTCNWLGGE